MPRRGSAKPHLLEPDPIYKSRMITKLINRSMKDGKKSVIEKQIYKALEILGEKAGADPLKAFNDALDNIRPTTEVRPRRIGGAAYQVPMTVRGPRRDSLAIRWLVNAARTRSNSEFHTFAEKMAAELLDALKNEGGAVKKRVDVEKMADANRAFAHFKW